MSNKQFYASSQGRNDKFWADKTVTVASSHAATTAAAVFYSAKSRQDSISSAFYKGLFLTLLGLGLIKINDLSANFNNPRPSLILNN